MLTILCCTTTTIIIVNCATLHYTIRHNAVPALSVHEVRIAVLYDVEVWLRLIQDVVHVELGG